MTNANGIFGLTGRKPSDSFQGSWRADALIEFVAGQLRPRLVDRFPAAAGDVIYFGHCLGGLFGSYPSLTATSSFDRYIVSSPSLWWDDEVVFGIERQRSAGHRLAYGVFFGIGSLETDDAAVWRLHVCRSGIGRSRPLRLSTRSMTCRNSRARLASRKRPHSRDQRREIADDLHATPWHR